MTRPTIRVRVLRRHIEKGRRSSWTMCPVALALRERRGFSHAKVFEKEVENGASRLSVPADAERFIKRFDSGKPVKPATFTLRRRG